MFSIRNVTKSYITPTGRKYVFRNLNVELPEGKNIGLMGRNGAGKSTLMRLLSGTDTPDTGVIVTDKSVSWPVGLSGGFQGSLSGKEYVKFVCRVYGFGGDAMREKIAYVKNFAEIGKWFDEPVRTYSSGMRSRLAFGLSMAFDFDYYLIDEVMAVGDSHFKDKCKVVFKEKLVNSNIMLVTHSVSEISRLCNVVVLIENGQIIVYDDVEEGIAAYRR